jgi:hypothetical protein
MDLLCHMIHMQSNACYCRAGNAPSIRELACKPGSKLRLEVDACWAIYWTIGSRDVPMWEVTPNRVAKAMTFTSKGIE